MKYYNYFMKTPELDELLSKSFDDSFGAVVCRDLNGVIDNIEICKLSAEGTSTVWTHYANIANMNTAKSNVWEVNEQFINIDKAFVDKYGVEYAPHLETKQKAMYIYGYFKTLGGAVRNLAKYGTSKNGRKPKEIYV